MNISNTIAGLATLALAAIPAFALGTAAHAAPVTVSVADLDLSTPAGVAQMNERIEVAAIRFCANQQAVTGSHMKKTTACRQAVRDELTEKLSTGKSYATR